MRKVILSVVTIMDGVGFFPKSVAILRYSTDWSGELEATPDKGCVCSLGEKACSVCRVRLGWKDSGKETRQELLPSLQQKRLQNPLSDE